MSYDNYTYSGIEWIGKIPKHWKLRKLKFILNERNEKNNPIKTQNILSLTSSQGVIPYSEKEKAGGNKPKDDFTKYKLTYPNDIVMNSMNIISGAVGLSNYFGCVSPVYYMFFSDDKCINIQYFNYIFQSKTFQRSLLGLGNGILIKESDNGKFNTVRMRIPIEKFNQIILPIPTIKEQEDIVKFLNSKFDKINKNIFLGKKLISLLEEKKIALIHHVVTKGINSNIEMKKTMIPWAENIPNHWQIYKGKNILIQLKRVVKPDDNIITCFRDGEVTLRSKRREDGFTMSDKEIGYQGIEKNDLVVHGMDGFAGAIGLSDSRGKGSPVLIVLDSNQNKKYLMYYLRNLAYNNVFLSLSTGIRVRSCDLRWEKLANLSYLLPPLDEQIEIANYLDKNIISINQTIGKIEDHINLMEEYKASLIHYVGTGKIDVRDNDEY